jgi:hypothetical protein
MQEDGVFGPDVGLCEAEDGPGLSSIILIVSPKV